MGLLLLRQPGSSPAGKIKNITEPNLENNNSKIQPKTQTFSILIYTKCVFGIQDKRDETSNNKNNISSNICNKRLNTLLL